jgi:hypothetical protein
MEGSTRRGGWKEGGEWWKMRNSGKNGGNLKIVRRNEGGRCEGFRCMGHERLEVMGKMVWGRKGKGRRMEGEKEKLKWFEKRGRKKIVKKEGEWKEKRGRENGGG